MTTIVKLANTFYLFPGIVREPQPETSAVHAFPKPIWANILLLINRVIYLHLWILRFSFIARNLWDPEIQSVPVILESHFFTTLKWREITTTPYPGNTQDSSVTLSGPSQLHFVAKGPLPEERESLFHYRVIVILVRKFF